jgi:hypothetical protein
MFCFAVGLVLPAAKPSDLLFRQRPQARSDLLHELVVELGRASGEQPVCVWWCCADKASPPEYLSQLFVEELSRLERVQIRGPLDSNDAIGRWLLHSPVLFQVREVNDGFAAQSTEINSLLQQRISECPKDWEHRIQQLHPAADGTAEWRRCKGGRRLPVRASERRREVHAIWHHQHLLADGPATNHGADPAAVRAWAEQKSHKLLQASDRLLWIQGAVLAAVVIAVQQLRGSLLPALLIGLPGAWLLQRQPRRLEAQEWQCVADGLWVQDLWHHFGLEASAVDALPRPRHDSLIWLLKTHQLWLWLQAQPEPWTRPVLGHWVQQVRQRLEQQRELLIRHRSHRRVQHGLIAVTFGLLMARQLITATPWLDTGLLACLVAWLVVRLGEPLPLVDGERLDEHRIALEKQLSPLDLALAAETLAEPNLRASVLAAVRRLGEEVLDLGKDGLLNARGSRRWLP